MLVLALAGCGIPGLGGTAAPASPGSAAVPGAVPVGLVVHDQAGAAVGCAAAEPVVDFPVGLSGPKPATHGAWFDLALPGAPPPVFWMRNTPGNLRVYWLALPRVVGSVVMRSESTAMYSAPFGTTSVLELPVSGAPWPVSLLTVGPQGCAL